MCQIQGDAKVAFEALTHRVVDLELTCSMHSARLACVEVDWANRPSIGEVGFENGHFGQSECTVNVGPSFDAAPAPKSKSKSKSRSQRRLERQAAEPKTHDSKASNSCVSTAGPSALDSPCAAASQLDSSTAASQLDSAPLHVFFFS